MFLSLKGSLGRNLMINRVGQRLLQLFGGASAAYSLRNLASNIASVVRVRRASDNSEKDFSAADISSGTLVPWVNEALNIKTYDFSTGNGGLGLQSNLTLEGGESAGGVDDVLKMSVVSNGTNVVHRCYENISSLGLGTSLRITFRAYRPSSNVDSGKLGFSFASGFLGSNISQQFFSADDAWEDFTFDGISGGSARFYLQLSATNGLGSMKNVFNGTTGDHIFIKDLSIDVVSSTGTVSEWYDQSGNGNDATQSVAGSQPKIVSNGSIITDSNGNQSIEFLRSLSLGTKRLRLETAIAPMGTTNFAVVEYKRNFSYHLTGFIGGSIRIGRYNDDKFRILNGGSTVDSTSTTFTRDAVHLATTDIATSGGTTKAFLDGVEVISNNFADATDDFEQIFRGDNNSDDPVNITELVIFGTNQSANREAIEANINNQYDIY